MATLYPDRIKDLEAIRDVFDSFGVKFVVCYGALLGMYRDGDFIEKDDDIDIAVIDTIPFETRKKIGWMLLDLGFNPQGIAVNVFGRMESLEPGYNGDENSGIIVCERDFKFTIFFFKLEECQIHGWEYVCIPKLGSVKLISSPAKFFYDKLDEIKIGKRKYFAPHPIEDFLAHSYINWKDKNGTDHSPTYPYTHPKQ